MGGCSNLEKERRICSWDGENVQTKEKTGVRSKKIGKGIPSDRKNLSSLERKKEEAAARRALRMRGSGRWGEKEGKDGCHKGRVFN